jgi:ribosomal protein L12E/L44/L45/RPP1/RPP2
MMATLKPLDFGELAKADPAVAAAMAAPVSSTQAAGTGQGQQRQQTPEERAADRWNEDEGEEFPDKFCDSDVCMLDPISAAPTDGDQERV